MSNESETRGPLNPYGDLSRRAMRELEAKGINPADAIAAFNATGDVQALTGAIPIIRPTGEPVTAIAPVVAPVAPAPVSAPVVPPVAPPAVAPAPPPAAPPAPPAAAPAPPAPPVLPPVAPVVAQSVFPDTISGRDERILEQRRTAEIPVLSQSLAAQDADEIEVELEDEIEDELTTEQLANLLSGESVSDSVSEPEPEPEPEPVIVTTEVSEFADEPVVIDQRDDHSEITSEFEPFMISTSSTGVVPIAGHALILPTLPEDDPDVIAQLNQTGEIVITGQITLPAGIASVGADTNSLDTLDVDLSPDSELVTSSQDLAPVSAAQAVSSFSGTTVTVTAPRRTSEKLPVVLAITAAVLAVGVVGLFVANFFLHVF